MENNKFIFSVCQIIEETGKLNTIKYNDTFLVNLNYDSALLYLGLLENDFEDNNFVIVNEESGKII